MGRWLDRLTTPICRQKTSYNIVPYELDRALQNLVLSSAAPFLLILLGVLIRRKTMSTLLITCGIVSLYLTAIPATSNILQSLIPVYPVVDPHKLKSQAIVVIGGGSYRDSPEYGGSSVSAFTLERIRYAAWLHRHSGIPILVSGGRIGTGLPTEAALMAQTLTDELGVPVRWLETKSSNTYENAVNSAAVLRKHGIEDIALVTHGFHMPRALEIFKSTGLKITPAPTVMTDTQWSDFWIIEWIPSGPAAITNWLLLREFIGRLWYSIRYS